MLHTDRSQPSPSQFWAWSIPIIALAWVLVSWGAAQLIDSYGLPFHDHLSVGDMDEMPIDNLIGLQIGGAFALLMLAATWLVTRWRTAPAIADRAPAQGVSRRELLTYFSYVGLGQVVGYMLGQSLGFHPISLHLAGSLYGLHGTVAPTEALLWAGFNFFVYALVPYSVMRLRGYSNKALSLQSSNRRADLLAIVVLLVIETLGELLGISSAILSLSLQQLLLGGSLAFLINFFGAVLPIAMLYAIITPRLLQLTGSMPTTVILGGLAYASLHIFESWAIYGSWQSTALSLGFIFLQYVPPGMVKTYMTLRTGNVWVHVWAYHAISSHVTLDTVTIMKIFGLR